MNIFCVEQNYFIQKSEQIDMSQGPVIFVKPPNALLQSGAPCSFPNFANALYCGTELVLRISKDGKNIIEPDAGNYYDSITIGINFTAIDNPDELNEDASSWYKAKAWNNSSIHGDWIPAANFNNKKDIHFCLYKNRELVQLGNSGMMINNFNQVICNISRTFPLRIGDLVFTGSPPGIAELAVGDKLEAFIDDDSLLEFDIE